MSAPTIPLSIASTPGGMAMSTPAYKAGWEFAEQHLGHESREVREAAARAMDAEMRGMPTNTPQSLALSGGRAYLTQRHESNQG